MFTKALTWAKGLSTIVKIGLLTGIALVQGTVISAIVSTPTTKKASQPPVNTEIVESSPVVSTKIETEEIPLGFEETTENSSTLEAGKTQIKTEGVVGLKIITHEVTITDGKETSRKVKSEEISKKPVNKVTIVGTYIKPAPAPKPSPKQVGSNCDPNYSGGCVPLVSYDLDCPDISFSVKVIGSDPHGFDRDRDGIGCESN